MSDAFVRIVRTSDSRPAKRAGAVLSVTGGRTNPRIVAASALVFQDPRSQALARRMARLAPSEANIVITGETGVGKELAARHIHASSRRRDEVFAAVNCAALSDTLGESELFGHERGAFTGAHEATAGWFETATGGTLFLDEIGELSLPLQSKILRVLQEREVVRLGSRRAIPIDVRLIAATNVNLERAIAAGRFREDLYYRLKVAEIELPPLRDRPGDIEPLARHFLQTYRERLGLEEAKFTFDALRIMRRYPWPGNIRELENVVHYALLVARGASVTAEDLNLPPFTPAPAHKPPDALEAALREAVNEGPPALYQTVIDLMVHAAYEQCGGNQVKTAERLGVSRNVLRAHLARLQIIGGRNGRAAATPGWTDWSL